MTSLPPLPLAFAHASRLAADPARVWAHATSMAGVNRELFPLARMTYPAAFAHLDPDRVPLGRRAFRSWILAFGILPIDYDDLTFVTLEPGRRFLERSPMLTQREWRHERVLESCPGGTLLTDRVAFAPRVPALGRLQLRLFGLAFALRHRNLRRLFGTAAPGHGGAAESRDTRTVVRHRSAR